MALLDDDDPTLFPKLTDEQLGLTRRHGEVRRDEPEFGTLAAGAAREYIAPPMEGGSS
jgi:hypothetical protein